MLQLIDAGTGAMGRRDRKTAVSKYARASELLFRKAAGTADPARKVQLTKRAQQLLQTVLHLRRTSEPSRRLLTQLLQELDGFRGRDRGLLFLAATNEPWLLDEALLRPGRFDEKCFIPLPDEPARLAILRLQLQNCHVAPDVNLEIFAAETADYSGADLMCLCERAKQIPFREAVLQGTDRPLSTRDLRQGQQHVRPSVSKEMLRRFHEYVAN